MFSSSPTRTGPVADAPLPVRTTPSDDRTVAELLSGYASTLAELRQRGIVRTNNAPVGDYAEWLVAQALDGQLAANTSSKSYDLTLLDGDRVQVKARIVSSPVQRHQLQASVFRSFDFEQACFVLLRQADYAVHRAVLTPRPIVETMASRVDHVNAWRVMMTSEVLDHQQSIDITARMRQAALQH